MEELKLILETIQTMGKDAQALAIIYFSYTLVKFILGLGVVVFALTLISKIIKKAIDTVSFGSEIAKLFNVQYGTDSQERRAIIAWIVKNNPPDRI